MKKPNEKWNNYLKKKNVRPKKFIVTLERTRNGSFKVVGGGAQMLNVVNQHEVEFVDVDARDIASAIRNNNVIAS